MDLSQGRKRIENAAGAHPRYSLGWRGRGCRSTDQALVSVLFYELKTPTFIPAGARIHVRDRFIHSRREAS